MKPWFILTQLAISDKVNAVKLINKIRPSTFSKVDSSHNISRFVAVLQLKSTLQGKGDASRKLDNFRQLAYGNNYALMKIKSKSGGEKERVARATTAIIASFDKIKSQQKASAHSIKPESSEADPQAFGKKLR